MPELRPSESVESRRAQRHRQRLAAKRRRLILFVSGMIVVAAIAGVVVLVVGNDDAPEDDDKSLLVVLNDYSIAGSLVVPAGDAKFAVVNLGTIPHNVGLRGGPITADLFPDQGSGLELRGLEPGTYELFCDIVGHEERGMVATLQVVEPGTAPVPAP